MDKNKYLVYLKYVLKHKYFVFLECWKLGIVWLGITHDWSKLLPSEFIPYAKHFYNKTVRDSTGYYKPYDTGDKAFDLAWFWHQKRNKHHWQYWCLPMDGGSAKVLDMPMKYRKEMLADWCGAGRAQGTPNSLNWFEVHGGKFILHPDVRAWIHERLREKFL